MTGKKELLSDFETGKRGHVNFAGEKGGDITGIGKVTNGRLTLEKVNYVEQLQHNLMSVSQICDKGNSVLFTKTEAIVLNSEIDIAEDWVIMRAPRLNDIYVMNMSSTHMTTTTTCLLSKFSEADSILWHRRMAHIHLRKMNFIIRNDLIRGVPLKRFVLDDKCVPCKKGKQHKKTHRSKETNSIDAPFELLHMDLFGPVSTRSLGRKWYCLVVTDDYSRFSWVFFLEAKSETGTILIEFLDLLENIYGTRIKRIRSDNGTEFKNSMMNVYCLSKGIIHQYSAPYEPQQNGVAERKNRTLIEAARTMLADSKLPVIFGGKQ